MPTRTVLVWMQSRTGSSMVTAVFAHHGLDIGPDPKGVHSGDYWSYEHRDLTRSALRHNDLCAIARHLHDLDLAKVPIPKSEIIQQAVDPRDYSHVYVRRNVMDAAVSFCKRGQKKEVKAAIPVIEDRFRQMDVLQKEIGGVDINADELWRGEYRSLVEAFDYCGLAFMPEIASRVIEARP